MVTIINTSRNIARTLDYNEQKLTDGRAELLLASGFIKPTPKLSLQDKLRQFERYNSLNERALVNTLHITLNFDPSDTLGKDRLTAIAEQFMASLGFGQQPFLVYQHFDSGHPHIHIVTTIIQKNGRRIYTHNLRYKLSKTASREIEIQFGLVKAEKRFQPPNENSQPVQVQKVIYGRNATRQAISDVLLEVISQYKFSSFREYNAVLKLYNVMADRGREGSRMFKWKGLIYRVLDERGKPIGSPIKASDFYHKPTLAFLEQKFFENAPLKQHSARRIQVEIEYAMVKSNQYSLTGFLRHLERSQISSVLHKNKEGSLHEITFVDHKTKTAVDGSAMGFAYSAPGILERLGSNAPINLNIDGKTQVQSQENEVYLKYPAQTGSLLINRLLQPGQPPYPLPYSFNQDTKKKKRQRTFISSPNCL